MESRDFRDLTEAYYQVYQEQQLDEVLDTPQKTQSYAAKNAASAVGAFIRGDAKTLSKRYKGAQRGMKKIENRKEQKEQIDLYDIILSHLLDEGYAETLDSAEVIMVNMSEDWIDFILEELTGERRKRALEIGTPVTKRVALAKEGQPITRKGPPYRGSTEKAPTKRGGIGRKGEGKSEWTGYEADRGQTDEGGGHRWKRKMGRPVPDTSDDL